MAALGMEGAVDSDDEDKGGETIEAPTAVESTAADDLSDIEEDFPEIKLEEMMDDLTLSEEPIAKLKLEELEDLL